MPIDFESTELTELTPRIAVMGVGGAGCNAVTNMIRAELQGVDFIVANTDAQSLTDSGAGNKIQLGAQITQGLGAGAQPKVGQAAAEESLDLIDQTLNGYHMAFITAGMGGGTGTGAAPVIARRAREKGVLTVGVVTKPFQFEGGRRMKIAESGIQELAAEVDTLIIIPNQNLFRVANERTTFAEAFAMADEVLHSGVRGITDLMVMPGLINLDFADVRTVMSEMGKAMMGTGEAEGETRAGEAAAAAISNPLLEEASLKGAKGVIINVTGGMDMTLYEVDEAVNMVREQADPDALIVFGSAFSQDLEGRLRVSVVATGIEGGNLAGLPTADRQSVRGASRPVSAPVTETPASTPSSAHVAEQAVAEGADAAPVAEPAVSVLAQPVADEESVAPVAEAPVAETAVTMDAPVENPPATPSETQPEAPSDPLDMTGDQGGDVADPVPVSAMDAETRQADTTVAAVDALEEKAIAARAEDLFVADAPMAPKASSAALGETPPGAEPLTRANAFDEAAYLSGTSESPSPAAQQQTAGTTPRASVEEPARPAAKRSFFQLMTAGLRGAQEGEDLPTVRQPAASNDTGARPAPAAAPARDQAGLGAVQADDRPAAPAGRGTEQLEIPSFLKRQQN